MNYSYIELNMGILNNFQNGRLSFLTKWLVIQKN